MRKFSKIILTLLIVCVIFIATGCQAITRIAGGTTEIDLPEGLKLEEITWKDDDLWYLTRPRRDDEPIETHTFTQSDNLGIFEGNVIIREH